jgi:hypothetical protein
MISLGSPGWKRARLTYLMVRINPTAFPTGWRVSFRH